MKIVETKEVYSDFYAFDIICSHLYEWRPSLFELVIDLNFKVYSVKNSTEVV